MTWIRKRKKYSRPKNLYDSVRIEEENRLKKTYGLKNKREIWKAEAAIGRIRNEAKKLIGAELEEQKKLLEKLNKIGFKVEKIADILALNKEDWLKRRLQSILILNNIAKPREARQLIVHKHVAIDNKKVNIPSYIVGINEEKNIQILIKTKPKKEGGKNEREKSN